MPIALLQACEVVFARIARRLEIDEHEEVVLDLGIETEGRGGGCMNVVRDK